MITLDNLILSQNPYPTGGGFPHDKGIYSGNWYEAHATDADGNEYMIYWTDVDWGEEDASNACDWDTPDYIRQI